MQQSINNSTTFALSIIEAEMALKELLDLAKRAQKLNYQSFDMNSSSLYL